MQSFKLILTLTALTLGACAQHGAQVTSGKTYLSKYQPIQSQSQPVIERTVRRTGTETEIVEDRIDTISADALVRQAADIEPLLNLPARIGLARIEGGALTTIPNRESQIWMSMASRYRGLGTFIAVDPFVANYAAATVLPQDDRALRRDAGNVITTIRLGAARQHMDAVLIYEVGARTRMRGDFAGLPIVHVLGDAPLPATEIEQEGVARAFLMDVRNGYPYGIASASMDLKPFERNFFDSKPVDRLQVPIKAKITETLLPQVEAMLTQLTQSMQQRLASAQ